MQKHYLYLLSQPYHDILVVKPSVNLFTLSSANECGKFLRLHLVVDLVQHFVS